MLNADDDADPDADTHTVLGIEAGHLKNRINAQSCWVPQQIVPQTMLAARSHEKSMLEEKCCLAVRQMAFRGELFFAHEPQP